MLRVKTQRERGVGPDLFLCVLQVLKEIRQPRGNGLPDCCDGPPFRGELVFRGRRSHQALMDLPVPLSTGDSRQQVYRIRVSSVGIHDLKKSRNNMGGRLEDRSLMPDVAEKLMGGSLTDLRILRRQAPDQRRHVNGGTIGMGQPTPVDSIELFKHG